MANAKEILEFILKGNADDAIKAFEKTGKSADKDLGKAEKNLDKLGGTLTKTGAGAVAFAGVAGAATVKLVGNYNDLAIEAGKGADATGLAVDEWSRWIEVAGDVGVEANTIQGSFQKFNKAVADGKPTISEYGVEIVKTKDGVVDANASFINAIDAIGRIEDPTKRAKAAQELFGKSYGEISELIEMGAGNVKTALEGVSDTKVIDKGELDNARDYRASMDALGDAVQDFTLAIGQGATPVVQGFADVSSKAIGAISSLDSVTGGAAGKVIALGVAGVGALGGLSLVVGQTIKMRNNLKPLTDKLRDAEGNLTGVGKAASAAGAALGALAAVEIAGQVFNEVTDSAGRNERSLQQLTVTIGEYAKGQTDATTVLDDFQKKVSDVGSTFSLGNVIKNFGKEINLVNAEGESFAYNIETIDKAFQDLLDTSPQQAELLVKALRDQAAAMGENAYEFDGYIQLADRYQERIDLQVGSQKALTEATDGTTTAQKTNAAAVEDQTAKLAWMYDQMEDGVRSTQNAADHTRDLNNAMELSKDITDRWSQSWDLLTGRFSKEEAWINLQQRFDEVRTKGTDAFKAVEDGTLDATVAARDQRGEVLGLIDDTASYLQEVLKIPPERATEIIALLDQGKLDEAEYAIALATAPREVDVRLKVSNTGAVTAVLGGGRNAYAEGGYTGRGGKHDIAGVVHKGEYVIPAEDVDQATGLPKPAAQGQRAAADVTTAREERRAMPGPLFTIGEYHAHNGTDVDAFAARMNLLLSVPV